MPSSAIASHEYDPATASLTVYFTSGRTYRYFAVPARIARGLGEAASQGVYFNARIRDVYPFQEVDPRGSGGRPVRSA